MPLFNKKKKDWDYEVIQEGEENILYIYAENNPTIPSIEDDPVFMSKTLDILNEVNNITKIIFMQKRDYEYDFDQTKILHEIAHIYKKIVKDQTLLGYNTYGLNPTEVRKFNQMYAKLQQILYKQLKEDPIGTYVELKRDLRSRKIDAQRSLTQAEAGVYGKYMQIINYILRQFEKTKLIQMVQQEIPGYQTGKREIYRNIFTPSIRPDFMFTKLMADYPADGEEIDSYMIGGDTEVTVFRFPNSIETLYHIIPPEFRLTEEKYELLDMARKILAEHKPSEEEFTDPSKMRQVFFNVGRDLIEELSTTKGHHLNQKEIEQIANILVRYTVGFGLIEVLLQDEKIQDISINSPLGKLPMFIVHGDYNECTTNILPTKPEADSWATKLRMISGRPLDEADPILDTELELPGATTRVSVITKPLDPTGLAFSFRRHRDRPWTLALFIKYKMINPIAAGVLSFLVDGSRTMLIAGTRSSGKSSFLTGLMVEIMKKYRIITIEDTLEIPAGSFRDMGFNLQQMKVSSALSRQSTEMSASDGIRSTLRLGDSALIIGEVRSKEAIALYEAMRIGAAANVVAGTIHADSPYGVYDRVVNDIGVPKTSFKATDIIIVANPVKSADGLKRVRRIISVTEVRKFWEEDPLREKGFGDLLKYNPISDELEVTDLVRNGESEVLKAIAGNIKEFAGNWDAVWNNIILRANIKEELVKVADEINNPEMLEAEFVVTANDRFHILSQEVKEETGILDSKEIFHRWQQWLKREAQKFKEGLKKA
jgi:archaeal flagellar protein FlaI